MSRIRECATEILTTLSTGLERQWNGRECILEMREGGSAHWRQMEWIGFYFEYKCARILKGIISDGPSYGRTKFDGFYNIPWDYKAHANNTSQHVIIINGREAVEGALSEYGKIGIILACGDVIYNDENRTFKKWHDSLKGEISDYERERISRGAWSRLRKVAFSLKQLLAIVLDEESLERCGTFQRNFRNSNGMPRREKVSLDLEKVDSEILFSLDF